jgi:hypothetical protein
MPSNLGTPPRGTGGNTQRQEYQQIEQRLQDAQAVAQTQGERINTLEQALSSVQSATKNVYELWLELPGNAGKTYTQFLEETATSPVFTSAANFRTGIGTKSSGRILSGGRLVEYVYDSSSSAADDGVTVLRAPDASTGARRYVLQTRSVTITSLTQLRTLDPRIYTNVTLDQVEYTAITGNQSALITNADFVYGNNDNTGASGGFLVRTSIVRISSAATSASLQAYINGLSAGEIVRLPPKLRLTSPIVMPTDKNLRIMGPCDITIVGDINAFELLNMPSGANARHIFEMLRFYSDVATPYQGTSFYIENTSGQIFRDMKMFRLKHFFHLHNRLAGHFSEGNQFYNVEGNGYVYGWRFEKSGGNASFSDTFFLRCKIANTVADDPGQASWGIHVNATSSLYRAFFGDFIVFPGTLNATGIFVDGNIKNASGLIAIEGDTGKSTKGVELGANTAGSQHDVFFDIRSVDQKFVVNAAVTTDFSLRTSSLGNYGEVVSPHDTAILNSVYRSDDEAEIYRLVALTNDRMRFHGSQPFEFTDMTGNVIQSAKVIVFGGEVTLSGGETTYNVTGVSFLKFNNGSATSFTQFLGGTAAQQILQVRFLTANTTLVHGVNLRLQGSANFTPATNTIMTFMRVGTDQWHEASRVTP